MKIGNSASSFYNANNDSFNRANTTGSLGNSDRGLPWDNVRQTWQVLSNNAYTSATQNQYALAVGNVGINNINARISIPGSGAGAGIAFWVVDQNNWYAAFPYYTQTTGTTCSGSASFCYSAGCTPSGCGGCGVIDASYTSCSDGPYSVSGGCPGGTCSCSTSQGSSCSGPTASCSGSGCSPSGCCSSVSYVSTTTCGPGVNQCFDTTNTCNPGGCGSCTIDSTPTTTCGGPTVSCSTTGSSCSPSGIGSCSTSCSGITYTSPGCPSSSSTVTWSAGACGTQSSPCLFAGQTFSVTCTTCSGPSQQTTYLRSCATASTSVTGSCTTSVTTTTSTYYYNTTVIQRYCNPPVTGTTTQHNFTVIKMVNGALSTIGTFACPSAILGLRVQTNGNAITVTGYSDVNLNTVTCQQTYAESSPNRGAQIGLLYGETPALGSSILDNFGVE